MTQQQVDHRAYLLAHQFLEQVIQNRIPPHQIVDPHTRVQLTSSDFLNGYLNGTWLIRPTTIGGNDGVYKKLVETAQNRNRMPYTIRALLLTAQRNPGVPIGIWANPADYVGRLFYTLCGYNPQEVVNRYLVNATVAAAGQSLLLDILADLDPTYQHNPNGGYWPLFSRAIIGAARYMCQFATYADFDGYVLAGGATAQARFNFARGVAHDVPGMGPALRLNFLKDCGYMDYSKPDVHVIGFCWCMQLTATRDVQDIFLAVDRVAHSNNVSSYNVDKLFWLIGSGNFHDHGVRVGNLKLAFLHHAQQARYPVREGC